MTKATNWKVSQKFLNFRKPKNSDFSVQKWIQFCEYFLEKGPVIYLYEARRTPSKYITLKYNGKEFKVRFSDHKPIKSREANEDCDFFVGVANTKVTTTADAIKAVESWMKSTEDI